MEKELRLTRRLSVLVSLVSYDIGGAEKRLYNLIRHMSGNPGFMFTVLINHAIAGDCLKALGPMPDSVRVVSPYSRGPLRWLDVKDRVIEKKWWFRILTSALGRAPFGLVHRLRRLLGVFWRAAEDPASYDLFHARGPVAGISLKRARAVVWSLVGTGIDRHIARDGAFRRGIGSRYWFDVLSPEIRRLALAAQPGAIPERFITAPGSFTLYAEGPFEKERAVAFLARLDEEKQPGLFIEAAAIFLRQGGDIQFWIMGYGPLEEKLRQMIGHLGIGENVKLWAEPQPLPWLKRALVFVSLQKRNNYPSQSLLEAMGCECAVVATDSGETSLLVDGTVGVLCSSDAASIAAGIAALTGDAEAAREKGRQARRRVLSGHTVETYASHLEQIYLKAAAGCG